MIPLTGSNFKLQFQASRRTCWLSNEATATTTTTSTTQQQQRRQGLQLWTRFRARNSALATRPTHPHPSDRDFRFFALEFLTATRPHHAHSNTTYTHPHWARKCVCVWEEERETESAQPSRHQISLPHRTSETW